ncbi:MAG: pilus assembly protein PilP [Pseudomonadota bacterium]
MVKFLSIISLTLLLSGCFVQGTDDLREFVAEAKAKEGAPVEPLPMMAVVETYAYTAAERGIRSPFLSVVAEQRPSGADSGVRPDYSRPREELEKYPLDSLRMVGILAQDDVTYGLVQSKKDRMVYRVRQGNYMGMNDGRISGVFQDRIELIEIIHGSQGGYVERRASISLGQR